MLELIVNALPVLPAVIEYVIVSSSWSAADTVATDVPVLTSSANDTVLVGAKTGEWLFSTITCHSSTSEAPYGSCTFNNMLYVSSCETEKALARYILLPSMANLPDGSFNIENDKLSLLASEP